MKPVKGRTKDAKVGMTFTVEKEFYKILQHRSIDIETSVSDILREAIMLYMEKYNIVYEKKSIKAVK